MSRLAILLVAGHEALVVQHSHEVYLQAMALPRDLPLDLTPEERLLVEASRREQARRIQRHLKGGRQ